MDCCYQKPGLTHFTLHVEVSLAGEGSINYDLLNYERILWGIEDGGWHWDCVKALLSDYEEAKRARISRTGNTILHEAVLSGHTEIVEKLVELMSEEELEIRNDHGYTALALAAGLQNTTRMVECMLRKNPNLFNIRDNRNRIPLIRALEGGNIEVARYLYSVSLQSQTLSDIDASTILTQFILLNQFDLALHLLHRYPGTAIVPNMYDSSPLFALATKSSAFRSGNHLVFWKNWIYASIDIQSAHSTNEIQIKIHNPVLRLLDRLPTNLLKLLGIKQIYEMKLLHHQACQLLNQMLSQIKQRNDYYVKEAIFQAIKGGIVEFIDRILGVIPSLLYTTDTMGRNILFYSVLHRQAKIFKLLYRLSEKGSITHSQDSSRSTILHMAAMLEPSSTRDRIPGEALKMQSELQWFKEVERICPLWIHEIRNDRNMTAKELFTHNHKDMLKEGEKWMKDTAASFTVIGTLIITIMFTAAFTVPGSNNQTTGLPIFSDKKLLKVFIIFDILSLFLASTSVLAFLGIVTSTHLEDEFSLSLPLKMITGQFTLFFSIMTMMIAFCAGVFIVLHGKLWMAIPVICLAIVTACPFASMLLTLVGIMLKQMLTYGLGRRYLRRLL